MTSRDEQVYEQALSLTADERIELADRRFSSLSKAERDRISAAWSEELDRRIASINDGTARLVPADEVFAEVEASLKARREP
jgi:putative addiction module component (TIGR02574 family)